MFIYLRIMNARSLPQSRLWSYLIQTHLYATHLCVTRDLPCAVFLRRPLIKHPFLPHMLFRYHAQLVYQILRGSHIWHRSLETTSQPDASWRHWFRATPDFESEDARQVSVSPISKLLSISVYGGLFLPSLACVPCKDGEIDADIRKVYCQKSVIRIIIRRPISKSRYEDKPREKLKIPFNNSTTLKNLMYLMKYFCTNYYHYTTSCKWHFEIGVSPTTPNTCISHTLLVKRSRTKLPVCAARTFSVCPC